MFLLLSPEFLVSPLLFLIRRLDRGYFAYESGCLPLVFDPGRTIFAASLGVRLVGLGKFITGCDLSQAVSPSEDPLLDVQEQHTSIFNAYRHFWEVSSALPQPEKSDEKGREGVIQRFSSACSFY